jgi:hypothetical protein
MTADWPFSGYHRGGEEPLTFARKLIACLCLAVVLLAALTPASSGLFWAFVLPLVLLFGAVLVASAARPPDEIGIPTTSCPSVVAGRAPPFADALL